MLMKAPFGIGGVTRHRILEFLDRLKPQLQENKEQ
jgi:hypothetical protein